METEQKLSGKLYLVDLAGSEKVEGPVAVGWGREGSLGGWPFFLDQNHFLIDIEFTCHKVHHFYIICTIPCTIQWFWYVCMVVQPPSLIQECFHPLLTVMPYFSPSNPLAAMNLLSDSGFVFSGHFM